MRAVAGLLDTFLELAGLRLQPWMAPVALLAVALCLLPLLRRTHRVNLARRRVRRLPYVGAAERRRLEDEAFALVTGHPAGLLALAQEALRLGRASLARRALDALTAGGRKGPALVALQRALDPPRGPTPAEERVAIVALLDAGLIGEAGRRLAQARLHWPTIDDWPPLPPDPDEQAEHP
jgi:hypothetical protein